MRTGFGRAATALFVALSILVICFAAASAHAEGRRVAVVVGIKTYKALKQLDNAVLDAERVAESLRDKHGFLAGDVHLLVDPSREEIESKWTEVVDGLEPDATVVFYYAGHGIELKGRNYLVTGNAVFEEEGDDTGLITGASVDFQGMLEKLGARQDEQPGVVGIFILDACRENPFVYDFDRKDTVGVGLGPSAMPPQELFVMYSAGIGQTALDGDAGQNSPFINALLKRLQNKDLPLSDLAQQVRGDVMREAFEKYDHHVQTPAFYDQLHHRRTIRGERNPLKFTLEKLDNQAFKFDWRKFVHRDVVAECPTCPEMVVVDAGAYLRGSPDGERGRGGDEGPRGKVSVERFAIGKFEVTNGQWDQCVSEPVGGIRCPGGARTARPDDAGKPVTGVSWHEANVYAKWLSAKTGAEYRLPTEAEWEYAARADTETPYSFDGTDRKTVCAYANGADQEMGVLPHTYRQCSDGTGRGVAHVGRYRPNPWGLHDVHGNVWEWTQDCWHAGYTGAPTDGTARLDGRCDMRVARGGSWRSEERALRSAVRNAFPQGHSRATLGFRVARPIEVKAAVPAAAPSDPPQAATSTADAAVDPREADHPIEALPPHALRSIGKLHSFMRANRLAGPNAATRGVFTSLYRWNSSFNPINVCFFDSKPEQRRQVVEVASEWTKLGAAIPLNFGSAAENYATCTGRSSDEHIRVGFVPDGTIWSAVGMESIKEPLKYPLDKPSMNFGYKPSIGDERIRRAILHEFGHALGLEHEHQHPDVKCWPNAFHTRILEDYLKNTMKWSKAAILTNLAFLNRGGTLGIKTTDFNQKAVMIYGFPPRFYKEGDKSRCYADEMAEISEPERELMAQLYPSRLELAQALETKRRGFWNDQMKRPRVRAASQAERDLVEAYLRP
jgi:formylglycine-generating enzyme required for sulfatase activity